MRRIFAWIKTHKLSTVLLLIIVFIALKSVAPRSFGTVSPSRATDNMTGLYSSPVSTKSISSGMVPIYEATPNLDITDRMVVTNTSLSLFVKDVSQTLLGIKAKTSELGGYMVNSTINTPEEGGSGYINIRVPSDKLDAAMEAFKRLAVKVVSENVNGTDVTDQYTDYAERLNILESTKATFQGILARATQVDEIMLVQERVLSVQSQIDSIKGQMKYLEATSSSSLISISLSTDELALPYSPGTWRPQVVYKYAVRAMVQDVRKLADGAIWVGVYAIIWLPILVIVLVIRKVIVKRRQKQYNKLGTTPQA